MWVQAGFSPDLFWQQTPHHFQLAMQGFRKRLDREDEDRIRASWQTGAFSGAASAGKLKPLRTYLPKPVEKKTPAQLAGMLRDIAKMSGGAMQFRKVKR